MNPSQTPLSNKDSRLFENPVLEKISRTQSYPVIAAYCILSIAVFVVGISYHRIGILVGIVAFLIGLVVFTLFEYLIHRFTYHSGEYKDPQNWQYKVHGVHHEFPTDKDRLAMPLILALVVSTLLFMVFQLIIGDLVFGFFPGFLTGYALYLFVHLMVHSMKAPNNFLSYLWKHHQLHHYKYENRAFGVSSPLWDWVFGTMPPKQKAKDAVVGKRK